MCLIVASCYIVRRARVSVVSLSDATRRTSYSVKPIYDVSRSCGRGDTALAVIIHPVITHNITTGGRCTYYMKNQTFYRPRMFKGVDSSPSHFLPGT